MLQQLRVLCVEDDPLSARILIDRLHAFPANDGVKFECTHATSLFETRRLLSKNPFDAVISDLGLPDSEGPATIANIRKHAPHMPLVALTADDSIATMREAIDSGADGYFVKGEGASSTLARAIIQAIERRTVLKTLRRSEALSFAVVNYAGHAILTMDQNEVIQSFNRAAEKLFGHSAVAVVGQNVSMLIPADLRNRHHVQFHSYLETDVHNLASLDHDVMALRKDGTTFPVELVVTELFGCGEGRSFCAIIRDLSEKRAREAEVVKLAASLRERNEALSAALREARAATKAKSDFLANMSHEIRTPMTAILGYSEQLLEDGDVSLAPSWRLENLHAIKRNGDHLLSIINDILDLSKIEAGKLELAIKTFSPTAMLQEVASLMGVRAETKGLTLSVEFESKLPETVNSDARRVRQILINLLGNAVKFTKAGGVRMIARFTEGDEPRLEIDVVDTGIGLTRRGKEQVFQSLTQGDNSSTRQYGGTGLGLTICRRLARSLGGDVTLVESTLGHGSRFRVTLDPQLGPGPAVVAAGGEFDARPRGDVPPPSPTALAGVRILFAEDGPDNQRLIAHVLRKAGAEVTVVDNGRLALDAVHQAQTPFDVILMDMQMPSMDGYEATSRLRSEGYTRPIIALTAHAMTGEREKCLACGCSDYATKPIDRGALISLVVQHSQPAPTAPVG